MNSGYKWAAGVLPSHHRYCRCSCLGSSATKQRILKPQQTPDDTSEEKHQLPGDDWCRWDWAAAYQDVPELDHPVRLHIDGALPPSLKGTYYRNGPAKFTVGGNTVAHPFDGDGAVCSIRFDGTAFAEFRIKYVKTDEFISEQKHERRMSRGSFGTNIPGGPLANAFDVSPKNTGNIGVLVAGRRLFALFEGGLPYEMDPDTLETRCASSLDGILRPGAPFALVNRDLSFVAEAILSGLRWIRGREPFRVRLGGDALASHFCHDQQRKRLVCMSYQIEVDILSRGVLGMSTKLIFYEYTDGSDGNAMEVLTVKDVVLPGYAFVHDFAITDDSIVLMLNPLNLKIRDFVMGKLCPIHCLEYLKSKPTKVYYIPRRLEASFSGTVDVVDRVYGWPASSSNEHLDEDASTIQKFSLQPHFVQHIANAWTEQVSATERKLNILYVGYPEMPDFMAWSGPGRDFKQIDPDSQPPSHLMHATFPVSQASDASEKRAAASIAGTFQAVNRDSDTQKVGQAPAHEGSESGTKQPSSSAASTNNTVQPLVSPSVLLSSFGSTRVVSERVLEFPQVNDNVLSKPSRFVFGASSLHPTKNRPQQAIGVYDVLTGNCETWSRGWKYYPGEPMMIPSLPQYRRSHVHPELDGYIVSICYDAEHLKSEVIVLDAAKVSAGPIATADLPFPIPHGLHSTWSPVGS